MVNPDPTASRSLPFSSSWTLFRKLGRSPRLADAAARVRNASSVGTQSSWTLINSIPRAEKSFIGAWLGAWNVERRRLGGDSGGATRSLARPSSPLQKLPPKSYPGASRTPCHGWLCPCHAAQADGEADQTGVETSLTGDFRMTVRKDMRSLKWPRAETATHLYRDGSRCETLFVWR